MYVYIGVPQEYAARGPIGQLRFTCHVELKRKRGCALGPQREEGHFI